MTRNREQGRCRWRHIEDCRSEHQSSRPLTPDSLTSATNTQLYLIHRHAKRDEIGDVAPKRQLPRETDMFFSSFVPSRWTPSAGPRDTLQTHMFLCQFCKAEGLRYQNSRGMEERSVLQYGHYIPTD